jgi:hypothetical protein
MSNVKPKSTEPADDATGAVVGSTAEVPEDPKPAKEVRYLGPATERRISEREWAEAGVQDQPALFMARNGTIPIEMLNERAQEVLRRDGNFRFE